jgi:hypothetical protein
LHRFESLKIEKIGKQLYKCQAAEIDPHKQDGIKYKQKSMDAAAGVVNV